MTYTESVPAQTETAYAAEAGGVPASLVELDTALASLVDAIGEIDDAGSTLEHRVDPVLRPPSPEVARLAGEIRARIPVTCKVADEISSRTNRLLDLAESLRRTAERLRDVRDRIDV